MTSNVDLFGSARKKGDLKELEQILTGDTMKKLVGEIVDSWENDPTTQDTWSDRKATKGVVQAGIRTLLSRGLIDAAELTVAIASGNPVAIVKEGIEAFQVLRNNLHGDMIARDGILGRRTAKALEMFRGCNPREGRGSYLDNQSEAKMFNDTFGPSDGIAAIYCHVEPAVFERFDKVFKKPGKSTIDLVIDAWHAWIEHIDLSVKVDGVEKSDANVVIQVGPVDGSDGTKLADSDVAGPMFLKQRQCSLKIDEEETFDESKFLWMMTHELGHILGMGHYAAQGMLMGEWLDMRVEGPTTRDTDILKAIWT